jgi:hypothetical protein
VKRSGMMLVPHHVALLPAQGLIQTEAQAQLLIDYDWQPRHEVRHLNFVVTAI